MSVKDEQIQFIISQFPDTTKDNTEFCIKFWEMACQSRGIEFPESLKAIIRDYKPEAVTRKRREFTESTIGQRKQEDKYFETYKNV